MERLFDGIFLKSFRQDMNKLRLVGKGRQREIVDWGGTLLNQLFTPLVWGIFPIGKIRLTTKKVCRAQEKLA